MSSSSSSSIIYGLSVNLSLNINHGNETTGFTATVSVSPYPAEGPYGTCYLSCGTGWGSTVLELPLSDSGTAEFNFNGSSFNDNFGTHTLTATYSPPNVENSNPEPEAPTAQITVVHGMSTTMSFNVSPSNIVGPAVGTKYYSEYSFPAIACYGTVSAPPGNTVTGGFVDIYYGSFHVAAGSVNSSDGSYNTTAYFENIEDEFGRQGTFGTFFCPNDSEGLIPAVNPETQAAPDWISSWDFTASYSGHNDVYLPCSALYPCTISRSN